MKAKIIHELQDKYFSKCEQTTLKKGEVLMKQGAETRRLYLVMEGLLAGSLHGDGKTVEVFRLEKDMLVGVHSFFSKTFQAYAEVIALEDTRLAYISYEDDIVRPYEFLEDFLPIIIDDLFERQVFVKKLMLEKENALIENLRRDKLATLGQMAAGIAHELNNAVGIIKGNAEWLAKKNFDYIKTKESADVFTYFEDGFTKGQALSSMEIRKKKQAIEKKLNISSLSAKKAARLGLEHKDIKKFSSKEEMDAFIDTSFSFWERGVAIHDMILASKHASNVITSVKSLGISERDQNDVDISKTLKEAVTLVKKQSEGINVKVSLEETPTIKANATELVQVWVNLIKNACECLKSANIKKPEITIESQNKQNEIWVMITDNGTGIPKEIQEKIFQPDFTTKKGGLSFGLGLGLPVVQKHINQYKGTIEIDSEPGKTTFYIKLPIK